MKYIMQKIEDVSNDTSYGVRLVVEPLVGGYAASLQDDRDGKTLVLNIWLDIPAHERLLPTDNQIECQSFGSTVSEALDHLEALCQRDYE